MVGDIVAVSSPTGPPLAHLLEVLEETPHRGPRLANASEEQRHESQQHGEPSLAAAVVVAVAVAVAVAIVLVLVNVVGIDTNPCTKF